MSDVIAAEAAAVHRRPPESFAHMTWRRFRRHRLALASGVLIVVMILVCVFIPLIVSEQKSLTLNFDEKLQAPSARYVFGTDEVGRDAFVRSIYGGRVSLRVGLQATLVALFVGTLLGSIAGYRGGLLDGLIMRAVDVMLAIPIFFVLLLLASYYGSNIHTVTFIIGLTSWTDICRLVRAEFLSLREKEFVEAARALGAPASRLVFQHLLPNAVSPIIVATTLGMARAIIIESALSYLGFGVQPPAASWGYMLRSAQGMMSEAPWLAFFPGFLIFITVLAFNFLGDGLRDALDPRADR